MSRHNNSKDPPYLSLVDEGFFFFLSFIIKLKYELCNDIMSNFEYFKNFNAWIFKNLFSENEEKFSNKCLQIVSQFCSDLVVLSIGGSKVDINGLVLIGELIC